MIDFHLSARDQLGVAASMLLQCPVLYLKGHMLVDDVENQPLLGPL